MARLTNLLTDLTSISLASLSIKGLQRQTSQTTTSCLVCEKSCDAFTLAQRRVTLLCCGDLRKQSLTDNTFSLSIQSSQAII